MQSHVYKLEPVRPYSLALSLKRLTDMPRQVVARVEPGPVYVRALEQNGRVGLVRVRQEGSSLLVEVEGDLAAGAVLAAVRQAFHLDLDLTAFQQHMDAVDPVMAALARRYAGAKPLAPFSHWESLAWATIGQQVNISFAFSLEESLVRLCGVNYQGLPAFPGPSAVAALSYEQLQAEKYSRRKAEYLIDAARAVVEGRLDLPALVALPYEEAVAALTRIRGAGRWTAECVLMDAGVQAAFPADDIGVRNAVRRFYQLPHQPTGAEVRTLGARWAPFQALACYYLWLALLDREGSSG